MARSKKSAAANFLVLADSHRDAERGKIDCFGVFTTVFIWATPAQREYSVIVGFENIPKGPIRFSFWLRKRSQKAEKLVDAGGAAQSDVKFHVMGHRLRFTLKSTGTFDLGVKIGQRTRWFPFYVVLAPWPEPLEGEALDRALKDPHSMKMGRAQLACSKCESKYTFEVHLDPSAKLSKGAMPFPESGRFKCPKCNSVHQLKDIEGQIRARLGQPVSEPKQA